MPSGRANSVTPSSSHQHNLNNVNHTGDSIHELNRAHESDRHSNPPNCPYNLSGSQKSKSSHHHSLDRDGNNKMYPDMALRHFYNTNPKPHNANCQQLKNVVKSRSNQSNSSMSKYDGHATSSINGSDECLNGDQLSISSHCSSSTATVADMHAAAKSRSASRLSKHSCKKHHNGA